jgi:hypothetical protein
LLVSSAEPNSGKSALLGVIGFLARRTLFSVSITGPALFRSIEKWGPIFVLDENDNPPQGDRGASMRIALAAMENQK